MSRQIRYRAWDKVLKEWNTTFFIDYQGRVYKSSRDVEDGLNTYDLELMQYTGLKDKKGVEIFEGDVVNLSVLSEVIYQEGAFVLKAGDFANGALVKDVLKIQPFEIIGNIYEHSHLLANKE